MAFFNAQQDPYDAFSSPAPTASGRPLPSPPRLPPPQTPADAASDQYRAAQGPSDVARAQAAAERERLALQRDQQAAAAGPAGNATEAVGQAAGFYQRALNANRQYGAGVAPRGAVTQMGIDLLPQGIVNEHTGQARQTADTFAREFVAATLRRESGAAINPAEYQNQYIRYFPQPGDRPETIAEKAQLRETAIDALRLQAGQLAPDAAAAVASRPSPQASPWTTLGAQAASQAGPPTNQGPAGGSRAPAGTHVEFGSGAPAAPNGPNGNDLAAQAQALLAGGATRQQMDDFARSRGFPPFGPDLDRAIAARDARQPYAVLPPPAAPPPPDISSQRGDAANPSRMLMENQLGRGAPLLGSVQSVVGAFGGPEAENAFARGGSNIALAGFDNELRAGTQSLFNGDYGGNLRREDAVDDYDSQNHFGARLGGQVTAGIPLAMLGGSTLAGQAAAGGAEGFLYGLGSGRGGFADRAENAVVGGAVGALAPVVLRGVGRGANWLRGRGVTPGGREVAQAAAVEGVPISRPIAEPAARRRMGNLQASVGGAGPVDRSLASTAQGIEARAGLLAEGGVAQERGAMGQRIQAVTGRGLRNARSAAGRIYDQAAARAGNTPVLPTEAVATLDRQIAELSGNAGQNRSLIDYLNTVRGDLVDAGGNARPKTIAEIRDLRTGMRGEINHRTLNHTNAERLVGDALDAARSDIARDLGQSAPEALALYNRGDRMWRAQAENSRQIVERLTGPADNPIMGAAVMDRLQAAASGSTPHFRRMWAMLSPQDRLDAAATIASRAGRKAPDEAFSPAQFIAWARTLPDSARQVAFGPEGARSIANLSRLSRELIDTRSALNNSKSGVVTNYRAFLRDMIGGNLTGLAAGLVSGAGAMGTALTTAAVGGATTAAGAMRRNLSARALMSPDMTRWLSQGARMSNPTAIRRHIASLSSVAARDPAIAQEATGLRQALLSAINDNAPISGQAVASPDQGPN